MKLLIAVETCHKFNYDMTPIDQCMVLYRGPEMDWKSFRPPFIRETWWRDIPPEVDKKFFFGSPAQRQPENDEVFLAVKDDYINLPFKTKAICAWAFERGYDYLLKADDDAFVYIDRFLASDFADHPWTGRYNGGEFVAGGPAYVLNRAAMGVVSEASVDIKHQWAEDKWASSALLKAGFRPHFDPRYVDLRRGEVTRETIAVCECSEGRMRELYAR